MRKVNLTFIVILVTVSTFAQKALPDFISTDIENFWAAYDKIIMTADTTRQYEYLQQLYLDRATPGLKALIEVRHYTNKDFMEAIRQSPRFWSSLRPNTQGIAALYPEITADIQKLEDIYPHLKPATIFFSIGAFRTNATIQGDRILVGSEMSLADSTTVIDEFPPLRQAFYREHQPRKNIALLCTHEYIHTLQKPIVENLLSMCLYEGVAEFISCKVTGKPSTVPAIRFGKANIRVVVEQFVTDLFLMNNNYNWLWGENKNDLRVRDLGYFMGYELAERYYNLSEDKAKAVKDLIELDYTDEREVETIVDKAKLLPKTIKELSDDYESQRPKVISVKPFRNDSGKVKPGLCRITINFSEPMDTTARGFDDGPLGESYRYKFVRIIGWSSDRKSFRYEVELHPERQYQFLVSNRFRNGEGKRLKPYLVNFKTKK